MRQQAGSVRKSPATTKVREEGKDKKGKTRRSSRHPKGTEPTEEPTLEQVETP